MEGVTTLLLFFSIFSICSGYLTYIAIRLPLKGNRSEPGSQWPRPVFTETSSDIFTIDLSSFHISSNLANCDIIREAILRYEKILQLDKKYGVDQSLPRAKSLNIDVQDQICPGYPTLGMSEVYRLTINETITLSARSVWGALRGLETFSQLIYVSQSRTIQIRRALIDDNPRFSHRGIMLDTARHYLPVKIILQNLDAMSYNKMNVFHWHIVDDQSFPYQSIKFPDLSKKGAFTPKHVYTQTDIKRILNYARLRGIRVVPEFDTPGHTVSWGKTIKDLLTPCYENRVKGVVKYNVHGAYEIVNPTLNTTYTFMKDLLSEIKDVFPDQFIHLGMDEAYHACWRTNRDIQRFMADNGIQDYGDLEQYYIGRILDIVDNLNKSYIIWQDPTDHGAQVSKDAIMEVWKGNETVDWRSYMANQTGSGHQVILSSCWYLNYISYGQDWRKYYECDPLDFKGTDEQNGRVLGGEVCLWAEYVDQTNLLSRLWPRASAAAERLWSQNEVIQDTDSAAFRLDQQRCRMLKRGIPAEPILDGYCDEFEIPEDEMEIPAVTSQPCPVSSSTPVVINFFVGFTFIVFMSLKM